ncbi:MAG: alkaline phosphatase family protein [Actinomycetota bacterium]
MRVGAMVAGLAAAAVLAAGCTDERGGVRVGATAEESGCRDLPKLVRRIRKGYFPGPSPDLMPIPRVPNYVGTPTAPVHSGPWDYLARVPLVLYGPGHTRGVGDIPAPATMADVAPTIAAAIGFEGMPERDGRALTRALRDDAEPPRLVVVVVWDGGGWNVLEEHPDAWPFLEKLMTRGASFSAMTIGSSPSVTNSIHTTLGTGALPNRHGIVALRVRLGPGRFGDPLLFLDPSAIRIQTLADLYDRGRANRPVVGMLASSNYHLGMVGHGASLSGGDRDAVVLIDEDGRAYGNEELFSLPPAADEERFRAWMTELDAGDGTVDGKWDGESLEGVLAKKGNPAAARYEQWVLERLVRNAGFGADEIPDLLFVNFKAPDEAGHEWGMTAPQVADAVRASDDALKRLTRFLDAEVGRREWMVVVTADHGQMPYPHESGGWAIRGGELGDDLNARFDRNEDGEPLAPNIVSAGIYLDPDQLADNDLGLRGMARWIARYTAEENLQEGEELPEGWEGEERLFDAVVIGGGGVVDSCG